MPSPYFIAERELYIAFISISLKLCLCNVVCCRDVSARIVSTTVKQRGSSLCLAKVSSSSLLRLKHFHENRLGIK